MEKLISSYTLLLKALATLEKSFNTILIAQATNQQLLIEAAQDSTIQRFEYCFDGFWKFLKKYLLYHHNVENLNSPRVVFQACVKQGICSEREGEQLIAMIDDRNETTHNYDADRVRKIFPHIENYYRLIQKIVDSLPNIQTDQEPH